MPPGIFGYEEGQNGINAITYEWVNSKVQRKSITQAKQLLKEAGYENGIDPKTKAPLILYFDATSISIDDKPMFNWYRKQFEKLGINLVIRATDYNRFQDKMRKGNAQIYIWGWNADYPDPENFFFLLYGGNGKVKFGGENASNYQNPEFDRLFEIMRNMDNNEERFRIIQQMQALIRYDSPWIFGLHPKQFSLFHNWIKNRKPHVIANNTLKYIHIDTVRRYEERLDWNYPVFWPFLIFSVGTISIVVFTINNIRIKNRKSLQ